MLSFTVGSDCNPAWALSVCGKDLNGSSIFFLVAGLLELKLALRQEQTGDLVWVMDEC